MLDKEFIEQMKQKLLAEKERVEKKIKDITKPEQSVDNPDWDDRANDAMEDIQEESLLRIYRNLQEKVTAALTRIEEGTYGKCINCQEQWIPKENLEKEPWGEHCNTCSVK